MNRLPENALTRPAPEVVLDMMTELFAEAEEALARIQIDGDEEAVHDFRVAVRRLRSLERAYRPCLAGGALRKLRKRLARVTEATGRARDLEVQLAWLAREREVMRAHERLGFDWLQQRLGAAQQTERRRLRKRLGKRFGKLSASFARLRPRAKQGAPFAAAAAERVQRSMDRLGVSLRELLTAGDDRCAHRTRIEAKRLRYLMEPLRGTLAPAEEVVGSLKALQDLLGEVHDRQVLRSMLREAAEQAGAEHFRRLIELSATHDPDDPLCQAARERDERAGLARLAREAAEQHDDLMLKLRVQLESGLIAQLEGRVGELLDALDAT
ncbi:MAG TPA: CHAD domain-containing protein [Thioalkalivibrio sp.]|nr:CHAD domain-containing protein [Thioalkalivibrio sp.]